MNSEMEQQVLNFAEAMLANRPSLLQRFRADFRLGSLGGIFNARIPELHEVEAVRMTQQMGCATSLYHPDVEEKLLNAAIERAIKKWVERQPPPYIPKPLPAPPAAPKQVRQKAAIRLRSIQKDVNQAAKSFSKQGTDGRYEKYRKARAFVIAEWQKYKADYENNKSEFSRIYVKRVLNEYDAKISDKQMREVWLKDTPSTGSPSGLPAGG